jgi:hypothetical protein
LLSWRRVAPESAQNGDEIEPDAVPYLETWHYALFGKAVGLPRRYLKSLSELSRS